MDFGIKALAPNPGWIQVTNENNLSTEYPLLLNPNGGNVGIGTTNPNMLMEVYGTDARIRINGSAATDPILEFYDNAESAVKGYIYFDDDQDLIMVKHATGGNQLVLDSAGNVGIGTTAPAYALDVDGTINGTDVLIGGSAITGGDASYDSSASSPADAVWVDNNGNVGIGTNSPEMLLDVTGAGDTGGIIASDSNSNPGFMYFRSGSSGRVGIGALGNTDDYISMSATTIGQNGSSIHTASDVRLKKNITTITDALTKTLALRGVNFEWIDVSNGSEPGIHMGMIAQEVEAVVPEVAGEFDNGYKMVKYDKIVPLLIEAIKELKAENDALKVRLDAAGL